MAKHPPCPKKGTMGCAASPKRITLPLVIFFGTLLSNIPHLYTLLTDEKTSLIVIFQSSNAYKALRKLLVDEYLWAVISLPAGVFNPYSGVKTSILLMDKVKAKQSDSILFLTVNNDGYDINDIYGVDGIESKYEDKLRGTKGMENRIIDAHGLDYGIDNEKDNIPSIAGDNVKLTIDYGGGF